MTSLEELSNKQKNNIIIKRKENTIIDDIDISNKYVESQYDDDLYDNFIKKHNIDNNDNRILQQKYCINIDSSKRNKNSIFSISQYLNLDNNPLIFEDTSNLMWIKIHNANSIFSIDDKIVLNGLPYYKIYVPNTNIFFTVNSNLVKLDFEPNFSFIYPELDLFIKIEIINSSISIYENIPLHLLTQTHKLQISDDNKLAFTIPLSFNPYNIANNILTVSCNFYFYQIGNIPLSYINATYPTNNYSKVEYHTIVDITSNSIAVKLYDAISLKNTIPIQGNYENTKFITGGNTIQIGLISNINIGYPNPNKYFINLDKAYRNVIEVKMKSSEIPNIYKNILSSNNMFYWNNLIDEYIYSIKIPYGYYTINELLNKIEESVNTTPLISTNYYGDNIIPYKFNIIKTNFNSNDGSITFTSFNKFYMPNCIVSITQDNNNYIIKIKHDNHNLAVGDNITIFNAIDTQGILANHINGDHIITAVLNNNFYEFIISYVNDVFTPNSDHGGKEIIIMTPNTFRIHYELENSFAELIGFENSLTNYSHIIENTSKIFNIDFYRNNYILLSCDELNYNIHANSNIKYFYKILYDNQNNKMMFNTFIDNPIYFTIPLEILEELHFKFLYKDGSLVDFYNIDHSFTLEITTISTLPNNTLRNPQIGAI